MPADLILAALGIEDGYYEYVSKGGREVSRAQFVRYTVQYASSGNDSPDTAGNTITRDTQMVNSYALRRVQCCSLITPATSTGRKHRDERWSRAEASSQQREMSGVTDGRERSHPNRDADRLLLRRELRS